MALQVWLPLNGNLKNQGLSNVTVTNDGAIVNNNGKIGKCYSFNNTHLIIDSTDVQNIFISPQSTFSMACWIYLNEDENDRVIIFGNYDTNPFINWELTASCIQRICAGGTSNYTTRVDSTTIPKTTWTHIAFTYDGVNTKFYVNGILKSTVAGANTIASRMPSNRFYLGSDTRNNATRLKGKLNDFRIYDHCLSAKEIEEIAKGLVLHYKLDNNGLGNENLIPGTSSNEIQYSYPSADTNYIDKFSATTSIIPTASQYILSFDAKSTVAGDKVRAHYYNPNTVTRAETNQGVTNTASDGYIDFTLSTNWEHYWVIYTQSNTTAVKHIIFPRMCGSNSSSAYAAKGTGIVSVKNVKFEEGTVSTPWIPNKNDSLYNAITNSNIIYDSSGYNNNGTIVGSLETTTPSPRYNCATKFNTTSSKIKTNTLNITGFTNSYTISWWDKTSTYSGRMSWGFSDGNRLNGIYNGNLYNTGDGTNNPLYIPGTTTQVSASSVNTWHHFCYVGDGTTAKVYRDGELWAQAKTYKPLNGTTIYLNGWGNGTDYSTADLQLSDFRIYCTALTVAQVKKLYNTSMIIDNQGNTYARELVE